MREKRLGDTMPNTKDPKWGSMIASKEVMSDEWHDMKPTSPVMSEEWVDLKPSSPLNSEKWVDIEAGEPKGDEFHEMKQSHRVDPYSMVPSAGDKDTPFKSMKKEKPETRVGRATQHTEFGSTREI
jgi:hypothetical protein